MPTVADLCRFLDVFAPVELAETWDNTGLLLGRRETAVQRAMTCLTLTPDVAEEAVQRKVQLVVTHHPILFRSVQRISDQTVEGAMLLTLIEQGVAVYSPHTAFDSAAEGINQKLAESLGLTEIRPLSPHPDFAELGTGRLGRLPAPVSLLQFLSVVQRGLRATRLEYCGPADSKVLVVGIGCGAADGFVQDAAKQGCDTFVTGEARFHSVLDAKHRGINLVLTGHYGSERPAVEWLAARMAKEFPGVEIFVSQTETDPLQVYCGDGT